MISGRFAFSGLSEYLTLQKVKQVEYTFPEGFDENAKDLIQKLLVSHSVLLLCDLIQTYFRYVNLHNGSEQEDQIPR